jgi:hypothetical protein
MIVLNGEPFVRYNLDSIYPFAHQIIVVEGACTAAKSVAAPDGHSVDGTLELLRRYAAENDPEHKLTIVTAKDEGYVDGFWPEKNEMCWAYSKRANGDYLWQVDSDEFYVSDDIKTVLELLKTGVDSISFPTLHFFGGLEYRVEGFRFVCDRYEEYHRLFKWGEGYKYKTHRPPTVMNERGEDLRSKRWLGANDLKAKGIFLYHYCYLFPHQVMTKSSYYATSSPSKVQLMNHGFISGADKWGVDVYMNLSRPYRMFIQGDYICWLERFKGKCPDDVRRMMSDVQSARKSVQVRRTDDIEKLLARPSYRLGTWGLHLFLKCINNPVGLNLRKYGLAFLQYSRDGQLFKRGGRFVRRLLRLG